MTEKAQPMVFSEREVGTLVAALSMLRMEMEADGDDFEPGICMTGGGLWPAMSEAEVEDLEKKVEALSQRKLAGV